MYQEKIYNLTEAKKIIQDELKIVITYATMISWVNKGFIIGSVVTNNGKRVYSMYTAQDIRKFIENYHKLLRTKQIRKNYLRHA